MGMFLPEGVGGRDAVHVAVVAVAADEKLFPGQDVGILNKDVNGEGRASRNAELIGIVDPFLQETVYPGNRFWLFLYPRTITGLRHWWSHRAFPDSAPSKSVVLHLKLRPEHRAASEEWLRDFCATADCPDYETVLAAAERVADGDVVGWSEEYLHFNGLSAHGEIPEEFWDHVEVVLGRPIKGRRATSFSCAC